MSKPSDIAIDAVITWVNANDVAWQERINTFKNPKIDFSKKEQSIRFNSIGEINIAITSIIKFAPFIKTIYLVTDQQVPNGFDELQALASSRGMSLKLIDHTDIFQGYEEALPTFNSCSIGCMLFRIPDLAEHFIVFNDDTFLMRPTAPTDFFINGEPIIRGQWKTFNEDRHLRRLYHSIRSAIGFRIKKKAVGFKTFQQTSAKLAGTDKYVRRFHTPVNVRRSTLIAFFETHPILGDNVKHRFRHASQFIISSLSEHLEIKNNTFHFKKDRQLTYFRNYKSLNSVKRKLDDFLRKKHDIFMTFQSLELADDATLNYILEWIDARLSGNE